MTTVAIIPARLNSSRCPCKVIQKLNGKRIIDHVIENVKRLQHIDDIVLASDDKKFAIELCKKYFFLKCHISNNVSCGSHRAYKFFLDYPNYDFYMTIPSDEPAIDPDELNVFFRQRKLQSYEISTFYTKFYCEEDLVSPLSCKIVTDANNYMIYNSRNVIPVNKDGTYLDLEQYKKHVGIFVFPRQIFLSRGDIWKGKIDIESLEQNRFMQSSLRVKLFEIKHIGFGIDVPEQIEQLEQRMRENVKDNLH